MLSVQKHAAVSEGVAHAAEAARLDAVRQLGNARDEAQALRVRLASAQASKDEAELLRDAAATRQRETIARLAV